MIRKRPETFSCVSYNKQEWINNDKSGKDTGTGRPEPTERHSSICPVGHRISANGIQACLPVALWRKRSQGHNTGDICKSLVILENI